MRKNRVAPMVLSLCVLAIGADASAASSIWYTNVATGGSLGTLQELQKIGVYRNSVGYSYNFSDLILPSITRINNVSSVILLTPSATNRDGAAFLRDSYLNTGLSSPGVGDGTSFTATDQWTQLTFDSPIVNSDGPDLVIGSLWPLWVTPNVSPYVISTSANHSHVGERSYEGSTSATSSITQWGYSATITSSADLLSNPVGNWGSLNSYSGVLQTLDLSSLGVPVGQSVQQLYLQDWNGNGNSFSPSLVAGFPAVPEPTFTAIASVVAIAALGRRRRTT